MLPLERSDLLAKKESKNRNRRKSKKDLTDDLSWNQPLRVQWLGKMNCHWRIQIDLSPTRGEQRGEEFYLDATDFDLESLLEEQDATKRAVLVLMNVPRQAGEGLDEGLRVAARDHGDALVERLFWDECVNASVKFSGRPGAPEFQPVKEPVENSRREMLMLKYGVEFGRVRKG